MACEYSRNLLTSSPCQIRVLNSDFEVFLNVAFRQRSFAGFIVGKSRDAACVGEVMLKGLCLAICGRATEISSEAVWRNIQPAPSMTY